MYTSVVDLTTKQGTARKLTQAVNDKVRPILEKQTGFVDLWEAYEQRRAGRAA